MRRSSRHYASRSPLRPSCLHPARRSGQWPKLSQHGEVWEHELLPKPLEHLHAIIAVPELSSRDLQERTYVPAEALRRTELQMIGHVRDGESRILEETRRTHEPRHGEVALGGRQLRAEEAAHQRAREYVEML